MKKTPLIAALDLDPPGNLIPRDTNPYTDPILHKIPNNRSPHATLLRHLPGMPPGLKKKIDDAVDYMNFNYPSIRVYVAETINGFGHQSSSLEVARQLRILGYKGEMEIVWTALKKEPDFYNLYNGFIQDMSKYPYELKWIFKKDEINLKKAKLGITGGHDYILLAPQNTNTEKMLILQPYQWLIPDRMKNIMRAIMVPMDTEKRLYNSILPEKLNNIELGHHYKPDSSYLLIESFIMKQLVSVKQELKFNIINWAIQETRLNRIHLMVIYSISRLGSPEVALLNLVKGLIEAKKINKSLNKDIVIFISQNVVLYQKQTIAEHIAKYAGNLAEICEAEDFVDNSRPSPGKITLCFTGKLPEKLFKLALKTSTLPPLFEGANSTNYRLATMSHSPDARIPFLTFEQGNTKSLPTFNGSHDPCQRRCKTFTTILTNNADESNISYIAEFIIDALDPDSLLYLYFLAAARKMLLPGNNITTAGLVELVGFFKKSATKADSIQEEQLLEDTNHHEPKEKNNNAF